MEDILHDEDWYRKKYLQEGMSGAEIAELCSKSSKSTVYRRLQKYKIPIRSYSEALITRYRRKGHPSKGVRFTEEHKREMSKAKTGGKFSIEHKSNLSKSLSGRKQSESHIRNRVLSMAGKMEGEKNPAWKGGPMRRECLICGIIFEANRASINKGNGIYCSKSCAAKSRTGEKSSSWQNGKSFEPYCPAFNNELKEKIRNRDNRVCVFCGKSEIENGERLSIHHIDRNKMQGCGGKNWYLVSLCRSCHGKSHLLENEYLIVANLRSELI